MARILHVTDTHLTAGGPLDGPPLGFARAVRARTGRTTDELAAMVLDHLLDATTPDLLLHTGDVLDAPSPAAYAAAHELLATTGVPLLATPGNHDDAGLLAAAFGAAGPPVCGHLDLGTWRVVVATSAEVGQQGGTFGPRVLEQLDAALGVDRPVLIGVHHPPLSACTAPDCNVTDAAGFFDVLDRHPNVVAVASGHLHLAGELERSGVRYLLGPSTCMQLVHVHPLVASSWGPTPVGARLIELHDDGTLTSEVCWAPAWP